MSAESQKLRRDRARELGMCLVCTTRAMFDGRSTCARCHELKAGWNSTYAAAGMRALGTRRGGDKFCTDCQMHSGHRADCKEQRSVA